MRKPRHRGLGEERTTLRSFGRAKRKIESRCQLEKNWPSHRSKRKVRRIENDTRKQARERPLTRGPAFSDWTRSATLKAKKEDSIRRMWIEERERGWEEIYSPTCFTRRGKTLSSNAIKRWLQCMKWPLVHSVYHTLAISTNLISTFQSTINSWTSLCSL